MLQIQKKFFRYVDDLFIIFNNNIEPSVFFETYESEYIKLDSISHGKECVFLDLILTVNETKLDYKLFQKPNNLFQYLPSLSNHKSSIFINLIANELKRYKDNCSKDEDFEIAKENFISRLILRGYNNQLIQLGLLSRINSNNNNNDNNNNNNINNNNNNNIIVNLIVPIPLHVYPKIPWTQILKIPEEYIREIPILKYVKIRVVSLNCPNIGKRIIRSLFPQEEIKKHSL